MTYRYREFFIFLVVSEPVLEHKDKNEVEDEKKGDEDAINENWNDCVKIFSFSWG